jgi:DNA polymerase-3 subunit epsilon
MAREIVLDTETTGLDARKGDRLIEIGCVELVNCFPTGREFHRFINPESRDVHPEAEAIHGISTSFLRDKPLFRQVYRDFLDFIGDDPLVIHNAPFDVGFINMEFERIKVKPLDASRIIDTLQMARRKHPGGPNTLDALCKRYNVDNTKRTKHGAITDSLLLAEVYIELTGARQASLVLAADSAAEHGTPAMGSIEVTGMLTRSKPLLDRLTADVEDAHANYVDTLGSNSLWKRMQVAS